ncbi:hypothetical protein VKT23_016854 [Stygiomarasmius scandens]|uniref:Uncharacterized protein n=1 Tax=Marasmiellus scandens TaxID=2682957 RepID=A0ABR1ITU5_9AGAR
MSIYPDEPLEDVQWGLESFVLRASQLLTTSETDKFVNLVLAGRWERIVQGNPTVSRVTLNGRQGLQPIDMNFVLQTRDYDSAVMVSETLPYTHLSVWPIAPFRETLTKTNHMKGLAYHGDAALEKYLHLIPNVPLGKVATRHVTRIFFPHMYNPDSDKKVDPKLLTRLYDECIRPAVHEALQVQSSHWPTSYASAFRQAQGTDGSGIHPFSIDLPGSVLGSFANALLGFMDRIREFKDAYFLHEFRGRKGETLHNPGDDDDRIQAFDKLFEGVIDEDGDGYKKWFVDVAVEVNQKGFIMQWKAHAHEALIRKALPLASDAAIAQLMNQRAVDTSAQIYDYAGFRSETGVRGRNDGVSYINVYTTDKSATYQLHKGLFSRKYPSDTLNEKGLERVLKDVDGMMKTFQECSLGRELVGEHEDDSDDDEDTPRPAIKIGLDGCTRFEIRIRGDKAQGVLTGFDVDFLHDTMIAVPMTVWWAFKTLRLSGIFYLLVSGQQPRRVYRAMHESAILYAVATWMLNALNYRESDSNKLMLKLVESCMQHIRVEVDIENEEEEPQRDEEGDRNYGVVPNRNRGVFFIAAVTTDDRIWRVAPTRYLLEDEKVAKVYRCDTWDEFTQYFGVSRMIQAETERPTVRRVHNKIKRTLRVAQIEREVLGVNVGEGGNGEDPFQVEEQGVRCRPIATAQGEDVDAFFTQTGIQRNVDGSVDNKLNQIWRQFPVDVFAVSPNQGGIGSPSYVLLGVVDRLKLTEEVFRSLDLTRLFKKVQVRFMDERDWDRLLFDKLFPDKREGQGPIYRGDKQNYPYCTYYMDWASLMDRLVGCDRETVRNAVRIRFRQLLWLPWVRSDRMWSTKRESGRNIVIYPVGAEPGACPAIAVNRAMYMPTGQVITVASQA